MTRDCPQCTQPQHHHGGRWYHDDLNAAFDCIIAWHSTGTLPNGMPAELSAHIDASDQLRHNITKGAH